MSNLIPIQNTTTMSSREIADLTGKKVFNVHKDIKNMLSKLYGFDPSNCNDKQIQGVIYEKDDRGYISLIHLDREHSLTLVTGYDVKRRHVVNKRWLELEGQQQARAPSTYIEALEAALALAKENARLESENSKLNTLLDNEFGYSSILRAAIYAGVHESEFNWRPLKAMTLKLGLEVTKAPSPRYGYQNLYPIRAFEAVYPDIDFDDLKPEYVEDKTDLILA